MKESTQGVLRSLLPAWVFCLLFPLPAVLFWHSHDGRFIALCCFFVGSTSVVVWSFRDAATHANAALAAKDLRRPEVVWRERMLMVALALVVAWTVFSTSCLAFNDPHDLIAPILALSSLIPSLCIAPYLTLATRKPFAAVVLTLFSLGCMKLVAGIVTCLVYGCAFKVMYSDFEGRVHRGTCWTYWHRRSVTWDGNEIIQPYT